MNRIAANARVVVVGGGIAGVSLARRLAEAGGRTTLLERASMLCAGATWHAAGLVTRFAGSSKLKKLHVASLRELTALHEIRTRRRIKRMARRRRGRTTGSCGTSSLRRKRN